MKRYVIAAATNLCCVALVAVASAQSVPVHEIHRLGGSTAFYKPSLTNVASVQRMARDTTVVANLRTAFGQAGLPDLADGVVAALLATNTSVTGGACSEASPAVGGIVECDVQPGQTLQWMAYNPPGRSNVGLFRDVRWAGKKPFAAFLFRVVADGRTYTFVIPKVCGNVSLMAVSERPREAAAIVTPAPPPAAAPPPPPTPAPPPPPPPPPEPQAPVAPPAPQVKASPFFIDVLFGKDRRVRPVEDPNTGTGAGVDLDFAQCSPLLGLKVGAGKRFPNDWEVAGAVGIALSLVSGDDKVREHQLFADVEVNKHMNNGVFVGTGLSLWDLTRGDTFTPAWMLHLGLPLAKAARFPTYLVAEGRWFLDHADDLQNNYQFWGGVRVRF